jgi:AcrR family transcriptional regulator
LNQDLRYLKTEENLHQAMLDLLSEQNYQSISVTQICKLAKCSRNAFYQHYESKENLYQALLTDIILAVEEGCRPVVDSLSQIGETEGRAYLTNILTAINQHRPILSTLLQNDSEDFSKKLKKMLIDSMVLGSEKISSQTSMDYIHFFAGGVTSFIHYWLTETDYDLQEATINLHQLFFRGPESPRPF